MTDKKEFCLIDAENKYLESSHGLSIRRQGLYPSEASVVEHIDGKKVVRGKCLREAYYRALELPPTNPGGASLMMKADLGKAAEEMTIMKWKEMGIWVANNIKFFDKDRAISGELDAVICLPDNRDYKIGIECKSHYGNYSNEEVCGKYRKGRKKKDGSYVANQKPVRIAGQPKISQFLQSVQYSHKYINELGKLDEYRMYYIERGDGHRNEFRVGAEKQSNGKHRCWYEQVPGPYWTVFDSGRKYYDFHIEDIYDRYTFLLECLKKRELPPRDYSFEPYDDEMMEWAYKNNEVGVTKYNAWKKKGEKYTYWRCEYCSQLDRCKKEK